MLDCETPKGERYIESEEVYARKLLGKWGYEGLLLPKASRVDRIMFNNKGVVVGVLEVKSRNMDQVRLIEFGDYMISEQKVLDGVGVAHGMHVPLVIAAGLRDAIWWWKVWSPNAKFLFKMKLETRNTQATCNGGSKLDRVYLLPNRFGKSMPYVH
jgi:hypothetical protein